MIYNVSNSEQQLKAFPDIPLLIKTSCRGFEDYGFAPKEYFFRNNPTEMKTLPMYTLYIFT